MRHNMDDLKIISGALSKLLELQGASNGENSGILSEDLNKMFIHNNEKTVLSENDRLVLAILVEAVKHLDDKMENIKSIMESILNSQNE